MLLLLAADAVAVPWDARLSVSFGTTEGGASNIKVQYTVLNHLGQEFFPNRREAEADLTEQGPSIRHEPFGGLWDLPAAEPYSPEITVGYHVSLSSGTGTENIYFAVKSEFPTLASASLRERVQSSADCVETLRVLETAGDTDGGGRTEMVCVGVTEERIPFLSVDGEVVLTMSRNDESYYDGATLCALELDGDGKDEVIVLLSGPGLGGVLRLRAAEYEDGCWRELPIPRFEAAVLDTGGYSVDSEGISLESVLELSGGSNGGEPVYLRVPVVLRLHDGAFHIIPDGKPEYTN